jgi:hypothetical protein
MSSEDPEFKFDRHFPDEAWIEMIRGFAGADQLRDMQRHLDQGCPQCSDNYAHWRLVKATQDAEPQYEPPVQAVHAVKNAFPFSRKLPFLSAMAAAAELLFDTYLDPLPAGVRGANVPARHLLHRSGDLLVDLRLENEGGNLMYLTGQILYRDAASKTTGGSGVLLAQGEDRLLAQTVANRAGEFQLEFEYGAGLTLYFEAPEGELVAVTLPGASQ